MVYTDKSDGGGYAVRFQCPFIPEITRYVEVFIFFDLFFWTKGRVKAVIGPSAHIERLEGCLVSVLLLSVNLRASLLL